MEVVPIGRRILGWEADLGEERVCLDGGFDFGLVVDDVVWRPELERRV